jgi:hypothetical protein
MSNDNKPLSDDALASLLTRMDDVSRAVPAPAAGRPRLPPRVSMAFEDHPLYQQMQFQRGFANVAGLQNPYYRLHDVRAGATSMIDGRPVVNFASYDYLGLNGHPEITTAVAKAVADSSRPSRATTRPRIASPSSRAMPGRCRRSRRCSGRRTSSFTMP